MVLNGGTYAYINISISAPTGPTGPLRQAMEMQLPVEFLSCHGAENPLELGLLYYDGHDATIF